MTQIADRKQVRYFTGAPEDEGLEQIFMDAVNASGRQTIGENIIYATPALAVKAAMAAGVEGTPSEFRIYRVTVEEVPATL